jgi:hypothetical protein
MRGWQKKDWWGSAASLTSPEEGGFYDGGVNQEVVEAFRKAKADPQTQSIVLTGRRGIVAPHVRNVLRNNGLFGKRMISGENKQDREHHEKNIQTGIDQQHPKENAPDAHEEYFVGDFSNHPDFPKTHGKKGLVPDGSTFAHKRFVIQKKVLENDGYDTVEIWDDRTDHIDLFKAVGRELIRSGKVKKFVIHQVFPPTSPGVPATVIHIPVNQATTW